MSIDNPPKKQPHRKGPERGGRTKGEKKGNQPIVDAEYIVLSNKNEGIPAPEADIVSLNSKNELLQRMRATISAIGKDINSVSADNGTANTARTKVDEYLDRHRTKNTKEDGTENTAEQRAIERGISNERNDMLVAEVRYFEKYKELKRFEVKNRYARIDPNPSKRIEFSDAKQALKKEVDALEKEVRAKQAVFVNLLAEKSGEFHDRMQEKYHYRESDEGLRARYERNVKFNEELKKDGKPFTEMEPFEDWVVAYRKDKLMFDEFEKLHPNLEVNSPEHKSWFSDKLKERETRARRRYQSLVMYADVTKPFILKKQQAAAEALEGKKLNVLHKAGLYFARKAGEVNINAQNSISATLYRKQVFGLKNKNGELVTINKEYADRAARVIMQSARLLTVTALLGGAGAIVGAPAALGLVGTRVLFGLGRIAGGTAAGFGAGALFSRFIGAGRIKKRKDIVQSIINGSALHSYSKQLSDINDELLGEKSVVEKEDTTELETQIRQAEKYAVLGSEEDIRRKQQMIELAVAGVTSFGVGAVSAHQMAELVSVQKAALNAHMELTEDQLQEISKAIAKSTQSVTEKAPIADTTAFDSTHHAFGSTESGGAHEIAGKSSIATESGATVRPEANVSSHVITAEPNDGPDVMFRKLKLSLAEQYKDVPNPPADVQEILDTNEHLLSRKYGLAWDSKVPGTWDDGRTLYVGDTFELKDGKIILTHNGNAEVLEAGAQPPVSEVSSSPVTETETPSAPVEVERPEVTVPAETPLQGAPAAEIAPESASIVEPASTNTGVHAATSLGSTASHTADGAVISTAAEATPAKVVAGIAPSKYNVPWAIPGETKSPFTNQLGTFVDPVTPHVYADGRSNVYVYGGSFDEQRRMASEYALKHPNTIVRYEGRPFEENGVLKRWTATALSDGDKVFNPDKPTAASEIGTTPDRSYFTKRDDAWLTEKTAPEPKPEVVPSPFVPIETQSDVQKVMASEVWGTYKNHDTMSLFMGVPEAGSPEAGMRNEMFKVLQESGVAPNKSEALEAYLKRAEKSISISKETGLPVQSMNMLKMGDGRLYIHGGDLPSQQIFAREYLRLHPEVKSVIISNPNSEPKYFTYPPTPSGKKSIDGQELNVFVPAEIKSTSINPKSDTKVTLQYVRQTIYF